MMVCGDAVHSTTAVLTHPLLYGTAVLYPLRSCFLSFLFRFSLSPSAWIDPNPSSILAVAWFDCYDMSLCSTSLALHHSVGLSRRSLLLTLLLGVHDHPASSPSDSSVHAGADHAPTVPAPACGLSMCHPSLILYMS